MLVTACWCAFRQGAAQVRHVAADEFADLAFEFVRRFGVVGELACWCCVHDVPVIERSGPSKNLPRDIQALRIWPLLAGFAAKSGLHLTVFIEIDSFIVHLTQGKAQ